jgi:4-carboxymuconolactone decarboxylase
VSERVRAAVAANPAMGVRMIDEEGRLEGPFFPLVHHPRFGAAEYEFLQRLRSEAVLSRRVQEILVLVTAASQRSAYEWAGHAVAASQLGITDDEIAGLAAGAGVSFADAAESAALALATELVAAGDASDDTYDRARAVLGDAGVVEAVTTVAFYQLLAMQMRVFQVPSPPGPWSDS